MPHKFFLFHLIDTVLAFLRRTVSSVAGTFLGFAG